MEKLNNPTILFGKKDTPYCITFEDYNGSSILGGGISCIQGYIYSNDKWGFQLHTKFVGIPKYRQKFDGVWSSFKVLSVEPHFEYVYSVSIKPGQTYSATYSTTAKILIIQAQQSGWGIYGHDIVIPNLYNGFGLNIGYGAGSYNLQLTGTLGQDNIQINYCGVKGTLDTYDVHITVLGIL